MPADGEVGKDQRWHHRCALIATVLQDGQRAYCNLGGRGAVAPAAVVANASCLTEPTVSCHTSDACGCELVPAVRGCSDRCRVPLHAVLDAGLVSSQPSTCAAETCARAGGGECLRGRCRCRPGFGMWNCTFDNTAASQAPQDGRFAERVYTTYYRNLTTLAHKTLESKVDGRHERGNSLSGPGSNAEETIGVRTVLPSLLALLHMRTVIDVPCGDFNYMRAVLSDPITPPGIEYTGLDIVSPLVAQLQATFGSAQSSPGAAGGGHSKRHHLSFARFDLATDYLWPVDLVVVRDILFHFELSRANRVMQRVGRSGCRFVMITTFPRGHNRASARKYHAGRGFSSFASWNLEDEPFSLPPPLLYIGRDGSRPDRAMGLWRCEDLWEGPPGAG